MRCRAELRYYDVITGQGNEFGAGGLGFDSRAGQIGTVSPTTRHRCDVAQALSRGDGPRNLLHASA